MTDRPALSRGEMEVVRVLWQLEEGTVRQIYEAFPEPRKIDFTTVQTYLRRLETKGYADARLEGRVRVYTPAVRPDAVMRETVDDLVDRLFGGEAVSMVRHLVEDREFTPEELAELHRLVNHLEESNDV